jgi:hypothetical protein
MSAVVNVSSAPTTAQLAAAGINSPLAFSGTTLNGYNGSTQVPYLAVNTLRLNNIYRVDARLTKMLPITERWKVTLNFEVFNLTNTIAYTSISNRQFNANGLNLVPASGFGIYTASGGFPDGTNARRAQVSIRIDF